LGNLGYLERFRLLFSNWLALSSIAKIRWKASAKQLYFLFNGKVYWLASGYGIGRYINLGAYSFGIAVCYLGEFFR